MKIIFLSEHAPFIHNLQRLAEICRINLNEEQEKLLIKITRYNLESRYPDQKRDFRKQCTKEFTKLELKAIEEVFRRRSLSVGN
ncbi:hypothetical protein GMMP15_360006 [Candidatus Magnetomoraceae bacterium gMMP-15]